MKRCPKCSKTYADESLNFCLDDGELLTGFETDPPPTLFGGAPNPGSDDAPPTVLLNKPRVTNQTNWQPGGPITPWQGQAQPNQPWQGQAQPNQPWQGQQANVPGSQFRPYARMQSPDLTLAIVSLCLGIGSITVGWCCSLGLLLSPAALITGFISLAQSKKDPNAYGGKPFAIAGISIGGVFLLLYLIFIIIYGALALMPS